MNKAKKILALLMALCMAFGVLSVSAFAYGSLQAEINSAAAGDAISWGGTSGPVVISKDITINFEDGAMVWSNEAKPAITIADGVKVTLNGVTAGVTSYDNFDRYDATDLPDAYLKASVPAIRVCNNAELNLNNAVVTGGEAKVVSTDIFVPVGAGVETYNNSVVNVNNSVVTGSWGIENTASTTVNIGATSIVAGYMDATNALYRTHVADGSYKLSSKEFVEAFLKDSFELDEEQTPIADQLFGDRVWVVVEEAPSALNGLTSVCKDGTAKISFNKEDTLWVPTTFTLGDKEPVELTLNGNKYSAVFTDVESGTYNYKVDYELRVDVGEMKDTINGFVDDFARDYWPDLNDNVNDAIDHVFEVSAEEIEPQLKDAYQSIYDLILDYMYDNSPLWGYRTAFTTIKTELHYIIGDAMVESVQGPLNPRFYRGQGSYFKVLSYLTNLKAADGVVNKAIYIRDNYQNLWNDIAGTEGDTLYVHVKNIYNQLTQTDLAEMINIIENTPEFADALADTVDDIKDLKALLKDIVDGIDGARDTYNDVIGGDEFQDYIAFASDEYIAEGDRLCRNIKTYYGPDFKDTELLVKAAKIEDEIAIENVLSVGYETVVSTEGSGKVVTAMLDTPVTTAPQTVKTYDTFTLKAEGIDGVFVFWKNTETGKIWSYDEQITITPLNNKKLTAVFMIDDAEYDTFAFVNENGACKDTGYGLADAPTVPQTLYNGTLKLADPAWTLVAKKGEFINIYKVDYVINEEAGLDFTVKVNGGSLYDLENEVAFDATTKGYAFRDSVYVVAEDEENFSYWKDQNNNIVSYAKYYSFVAIRNVELTAVTGAAVEDEIAFNTYFVDDNGAIDIFAERSIVPGSTKKVIEVGTLVAIRSDITNDQIVIGTKGVSRTTDSVTGKEYSANGTYWSVLNKATVERIRAGVSTNNYVLRARGYIVCKDTVTGAITTEYAPVVTYTNFA